MKKRPETKLDPRGICGERTAGKFNGGLKREGVNIKYRPDGIPENTHRGKDYPGGRVAGG